MYAEPLSRRQRKPTPGCELGAGERGAGMRTTFVAAANLETAPLADGGAVLYDARTSKFIMLNPSADRLWSELSNARTEDDLVQGLCSTYSDIDTPTARQAVRQALESLRGLDLVRAQPEGSDAVRAPSASGRGTSGQDRRTGFTSPSVDVLAEDDLLKVFQMTAAEISVAGCWWSPCRSTPQP
jgi:hypothetical protein